MTAVLGSITKRFYVVSCGLRSLSGRLFLLAFASGRLDDPELEPVLHKAFPGFHGFRLALQVLRLTCAVEVSGMNEDPRSHIPSTKLLATLVQKLAIVSSCRT